MKYYIEITLLPSVEIGLYFLWQKVYQQIHLGFAAIKNSNGEIPIGISFPGYDDKKNQLGNKLRLFAKDKQVFGELNIGRYLNRLLDYVHITQIRDVPDNVTEFAVFKRQQVKSSNTRLARRKAKRAGITFEQAFNMLNKFEEKRVKTPFINMQSQSSNKRFHLMILKQSTSQMIDGSFNCYGLSKTATVPWF